MANNHSGRKAPAPTKGAVTEVSAQDARNGLAELLSRAEYGGERIKIVRHGKPVAVLISLRDFDRLSAA